MYKTQNRSNSNTITEDRDFIKHLKSLTEFWVEDYIQPPVYFYQGIYSDPKLLIKTLMDHKMPVI